MPKPLKLKELREAWHAENWTKTPSHGDEMARRLRALDEIPKDKPKGDATYRCGWIDAIAVVRRILDGKK